MEISILIPEHCRALRLQQVVRNIRETSRFHHELIVVGDRFDTDVVFDYPPHLVDKDIEQPLKMRDWLKKHKSYLSKYDVTLKECPLDYEITGEFLMRDAEQLDAEHAQRYKPRGKTLGDLGQGDFGADVVINWIVETDGFKHDYFMVTDDDMFFLKDWDYQLLKHVKEQEELDFVYTPTVYNVRKVDKGEKVGVYPTYTAVQILVPPNSFYLHIADVAEVSEKGASQFQKEVLIKPCGENGRRSPFLPLIINKKLWKTVGGRDYLISSALEEFPGRFVGGAERCFDDKLGESGVLKKICLKSVCVHTKHPLKFSEEKS